MTPWTGTFQAPLSMGFSRQEYWNGLPFPTPGDLPDPGIGPESLTLAGKFFTTEPSRKPRGFPCFLQLSLNLSIRSSCSEPQSAPGLVFADCLQLFHFSYKECYQSDFSIDHLVMSMCEVVSCVVEKGLCYD